MRDGLTIEQLLDAAKKIVKQHEFDTKKNGEDFNLFSILGMEYNETKTHSGMLVALLDPNGNHYQEDLFLRLFLDQIGYDYSGENLKLVKVESEHHIGKITKDYLSGGFIDILITFSSNKIIAIENKIYAGDQPKQMYRYSLYRPSFLSLYYLNLFGDNPSADSLQDLKEEDYKIITYRNHILNWLEKCMATVPAGSIIETSLKQYYILLKQLTNSMENVLENQLQDVILKDLEGASFIHSHYQKAIENIKDKFKIAVFQTLEESLMGKFPVRLGNDISSVHSQIWIDGKYENRNIIFGIESFSGLGHFHGRLFVGVIDKEAKIEILHEEDQFFNYGWQSIRTIKTNESNPLNLSSLKTLQKLHNDKAYFDSLVKTTAEQTIAFVETYQADFDRKTNL